MAEPFEFRLTKDEALVLFEWLTRLNKAESSAFENQVVRRALLNLECLFEKGLAEPSYPNWETIIREARSRLRDPTD